MNKIKMVGIVLVFATMTLSGTYAYGQDLIKSNPKYTKLLTDTLGVRMVKITLEPGEELMMHVHPVQMMYCLEGGHILVNYKSGKKEEFDIKPGDAMQAPAEPPHTTKNTGNSTISWLEIEIKGMRK